MPLLSDRIKIGVLVVGYVICLTTLWTSASTTMGNAAMRVVSPMIQQHCQATGSSSDATKCAQVVRQAYRHINLGGCAMEIKAWTLCETEWCQGGGIQLSPLACRDECAMVRESLQACKNRVVRSYFLRNGLENDGTAKVK